MNTLVKKPSAKKKAHEAFLGQLDAARMPYQTEYVFAPRVDGKPLRRWRFDVALPGYLIAVEIEGALFVGGRHGGGRSVVRDVEKRQAAAALGWRVIPVTPQQAKNGYALKVLQWALGEGEALL